jgi:hypothetical protein
MIQLFDPQHFKFILSSSSPSYSVDYDGVLSSPSSSTMAPFFIQPMLPSLHRIFKLVVHTHHHLDHFHFLATFCM